MLQVEPASDRPQQRRRGSRKSLPRRSRSPGAHSDTEHIPVAGLLLSKKKKRGRPAKTANAGRHATVGSASSPSPVSSCSRKPPPAEPPETNKRDSSTDSASSEELGTSAVAQLTADVDGTTAVGEQPKLELVEGPENSRRQGQAGDGEPPAAQDGPADDGHIGKCTVLAVAHDPDPASSSPAVSISDEKCSAAAATVDGPAANMPEIADMPMTESVTADARTGDTTSIDAKTGDKSSVGVSPVDANVADKPSVELPAVDTPTATPTLKSVDEATADAQSSVSLGSETKQDYELSTETVLQNVADIKDTECELSLLNNVKSFIVEMTDHSEQKMEKSGENGAPSGDKADDDGEASRSAPNEWSFPNTAAGAGTENRRPASTNSINTESAVSGQQRRQRQRPGGAGGPPSAPLQLFPLQSPPPPPPLLARQPGRQAPTAVPLAAAAAGAAGQAPDMIQVRLVYLLTRVRRS